MPSPGSTALPESTAAPEVVRHLPPGGNFYRTRNRFYTALLLFVVLAGLPVVSVPSLRHRLSDRIQDLREAWAGGKIKPVVLSVGENKEPFPSEYEKKAGPPNYPKLPPSLAAVQGLGGPVVSAVPVPSQPPTRTARTIRIPRTSPGSEAQPTAGESAAQAPAEQASVPGEAQPSYRQGEIEKQAYDLLIQSTPALNSLVQGSNPSLRFKSWDALKRDEDTYWVRVTFNSVPGNSSVEYIWQVRLLAKQVTPLSYNARSLANP